MSIFRMVNPVKDDYRLAHLFSDRLLGSLCLATSRNGFDPTLIWLPGKQQRIWKEFWVQGQVKVSEDYVTAAIDRQPVKANSVYDVIVFEQVEINKLFELMEHWPLFRDTYAEKRPTQFSFFVKPTQGNYKNFVQLLDKMLSDNLNIAAFGGDVERQERISEVDPKIRTGG